MIATEKVIASLRGEGELSIMEIAASADLDIREVEEALDYLSVEGKIATQLDQDRWVYRLVA